MEIIGTNISMIRGDSESITIFLKDSFGNSLPFEDGDTLFFTVKDNINTDKITLQKIITTFQDDTAVIGINPEDTKGLRFKEYVYDIQLNRAGGYVKTIIPPSKFTIKGEVTYD